MAKKRQSTKSMAKEQTANRIKRTEAYAEKVRKQFAATANAILDLNKQMPTLDTGVMFSFDAQSNRTRAKVESLFRQLHSVCVAAIQNGIKLEWEEANTEVDKLITSTFGQEILDNPKFTAWTNRNETAMQAFISRSEKGLNLSDRVWKPVRQLRDEMEVAITVAIGEGQSASTMSRKVREYLNDPDLMFRRFRYKDPETGEWKKKWKKRIKDETTGKYRWIDYDKDDYKTGAGVYKSSAKNAMRVTRTETNIAYRRADHERWQALDFVLGIEIHLSHSHPKKDICDKLSIGSDASVVGRYPKEFVFDGWHPQCFCYAVPILADWEEQKKMEDAMIKGEKYVSPNMVNDYPPEFKDWVEEHAEHIEAARERGTEPYFIKNNANVIDGILHPEAKPSVQDIAKARHEARTPEKEQMLRDYWNKKVAEGEARRKHQAILDAAAKRHAERTPKQIAAIKQAWNTRKATHHYGENMLSVMGGISDVDTSALADALKHGNQADILAEGAKLKAIGKQITALVHLDNPLQVAKTYSMADAVAVNKAVVERIKREGITDLKRMEKWLESEIKWVEDHKKYSTWKAAQDAYKKELSIVKHKIAVKGVVDSVDDALAYSVTTRSKAFKALADEMRTMLSSSHIDIDIAKAKAAELNKQYDKLRKRGLKKAKVGGSGSIATETIEELKKRMGDKFPKTLPNLEKAITEYEKTSQYGKTAKTYKDEIEVLMRKVFDAHDLGMNINDDTLDAVLSSWFKNTFETGSSGGYEGSKKTTGAIETSHHRLGAAHRLFGLDSDLKNGQLARHDYEKYGNLLDHDILQSMTYNTAKQYGNVEVRFKKDKVVATWTAGDSLGERYQPSLVSDPRSCSFDNMTRTPTSASEDITNLAEFKRNHISGYLELQYHGELTVDCVESLTFPYDIQDAHHSKFLAVAKKWKAVGAKVYYISGGTLLEL